MTFDDLASRYQSRRVARDDMEGTRAYINSEHWWWWNPVIGLERLELERARQAAQQSDAKDPLFNTER